MYVHEIKFPETDKFSKQFNECSELFQKWKNEENEEIREKYWEGFIIERWRLETGSY